jgi:hypothetical protein
MLPPPRPRRKAKDHRAQAERKVAGPNTRMSLRGAQRRSNLNPPGGRLLRCARNDMGAEPSDDCVFALPPGGTQPAHNDMVMISPASPGVLCGSAPGVSSHFPACLRLPSLRPTACRLRSPRLIRSGAGSAMEISVGVLVSAQHTGFEDRLYRIEARPPAAVAAIGITIAAACWPAAKRRGPLFLFVLPVTIVRCHTFAILCGTNPIPDYAGRDEGQRRQTNPIWCGRQGRDAGGRQTPAGTTGPNKANFRRSKKKGKGLAGKELW